MEFRGYQTHLRRLAAAGRPDARCSRQHDSLYRLLPRPARPTRPTGSQSADELRVQLLGVLREVVALDAGRARPRTRPPSLLFDVPTVADDALAWQHLPALRRRRGRPAGGVAADGRASTDPAQRLAALEQARRAPAAEVLLATRPGRARARRRRPGRPGASRLLARRPVGVARGLDRRPRRARPGHDERRARAPSTPSTARCRASSPPSSRSRSPARPAARPTSPSRSTSRVRRTDANYVAPAAFGLARIRAGRGDIDGAVAPSTSCRRPAVPSPRRVARRAGLLAESGGGLPSLAAALASIDDLTIDPVDRSRFRVDVLELALSARDHPGRRPVGLPRRVTPPPSPPCVTALESAYRDLATHADSRRGAGPSGRRGQRGPPLDAAMTGTAPDLAAGVAGAEAGMPAEAVAPSCPACSAQIGESDRFCEACGAELAPDRGARRRRQLQSRPPGPAASAAARSPPTATAPSADARARDRRDHFVEEPAPWVAAVCDRGIRHDRNEDAVALMPRAEPGSRAVLVVCDGVSSATDSDVASLAAARAARDVLAALPPAGAGHRVRRRRRRRRGPGGRRGRANEAVIRAHRRRRRATRRRARSSPRSSSTRQLVAGWVGDSRVYWLPDAGRRRAAQHRRLVRRGADRRRDVPRPRRRTGRRRTRSPGGSASTRRTAPRGPPLST